MNPALYQQYKPGDTVRLRVRVNAFKDYVFYQDDTCRR